jgi:hypothetical protein
MVEGYGPAYAAFDRWYPSTTFGGPPPRSGEERNVPFQSNAAILFGIG